MSADTRAVAIIPARGGSTRIKRKNMREICGMALLEWAIATALDSGVGDVVVSTDDAEIANTSIACGAEVVVRDECTRGDGPLEPVIIEAADLVNVPTVVILQPTSPLRETRHINEALELFRSSGGPVASVHIDPSMHFACTEVANRAVRIHEGRPRTQDVRMLVENGAIYVVSAEQLRTTRMRHTGHFIPYYMDPVSGFDINEPHDLIIAEALMLKRKAREASKRIGCIRTLVVDVDGVLTDNRVRFGRDGEALLSFDRGDGMGLVNVAQMGIEVMAVSGSHDGAAERRCHELGVTYYGGVHDKVSLLDSLGVDWSELAYVGNDTNDSRAMAKAAFSAAPADAHVSALQVASYVTKRHGGAGAVREVCDMICGADTRNS